MSTVVLCIKKPSALLRGVIRGVLLEVQAGVFIGNLDAKRIQTLYALVEESKCSATLCVTHKKTVVEHRIKVFGDSPRRVVEIDGIQLVSVSKSMKSIS